MAKPVAIAVVGGGASGMAAAVMAAQTMAKQKKPGRILLLEKESRVGKKLLATGNGRCNLSNLDIAPSHYHGAAEWATPLLEAYPAKAVLRQFEKMGLLCRSDSAGRVYPYGQQASAVLEILRLQLEHYGVEVVCDFPVSGIGKEGSRFRLTGPEGKTVTADKVILSAGGRASPKLGSDGSGTALASRVGHTIIKERPALVQVKSGPGLMKGLAGMRSQCVVTLLENGRPTKKEMGEVQFTDHGLSGICVFQLSGRIGQLLSENVPVALSLDLMPEWKADHLTKQIAGQGKRYGDLPAIDLLCGFVNRRVGQAVVKTALGKETPALAKDCTYDQFEQIGAAVKDFRFPVTGTMGWDSAQVTAGGVAGKEIDGATMESKRCPGLYLTGELIDIDGDCGGFNLHWAWATGMAAGKACAAAWEEKTV